TCLSENAQSHHTSPIAVTGDIHAPVSAEHASFCIIVPPYSTTIRNQYPSTLMIQSYLLVYHQPTDLERTPIFMHHDHQDTSNSDNPHPTQSAYLSGAQILPRRISPNMTVAELIEQQFQAYNAARLHEAARLYAEEMLNPTNDVTVGLTMAGALTPAGLGGCLITLMENGFVDFIISTGANLYHDMHHALAMSLHRGDFRLDDTKLQEEGVIRIYDILFA